MRQFFLSFSKAEILQSAIENPPLRQGQAMNGQFFNHRLNNL